MSAERDLILAVIRRLNADGVLDGAAISDIADELDALGGDDREQIAHETRLTLLQRPKDSRAEMWVQHRRRQMVLRTEWLENKRKGERDEDRGGD